jgi:hypothetical protein
MREIPVDQVNTAVKDSDIRGDTGPESCAADQEVECVHKSKSVPSISQAVIAAWSSAIDLSCNQPSG